ncbi:MAG: acyl-CoA dehydrogenase family protein [Alphaproteobacteria bacterium]
MIPRAPEAVAALTAAIAGLAPLVRRHRASFDAARRLPDEVVRAAAEAGLFRLFLPRWMSGPELSPLDFMEVVEAAAAVDGSFGWIVANGGGMSRIAGYVAPDVARAWFADPLAFVASATGATGTARPVDGGYRVSGRWPFASGIHHATIVMALAAVAGAPAGDPPRVLCCHMARAEVSDVDTWHVSGLRGTGSCDFVAEDVFVPAGHIHEFPVQRPADGGALYRLPNMSVFPWTVAVVPLGIARAAIDCFAATAAPRSRGAGPALRDRETVQAEVGRADALLRAGRAFLIAAMTELMAANDAGDDGRLVEARAVLRTACAHAAESANAIIDRLSATAGAISIFESCDLERCARDVHAATRHIAMSPASYILNGRLVLGLDPAGIRF